MRETETFVVRSGTGKGVEMYNFHDAIELATRVPRQHSGWQSVAYKGKRYVLGGGIRTTLYVNLSRPI